MTTIVHHPLPYRLILLDCDDTVRRCTVPGQPCPNRPGEWELLPNVKEVLAQYPLDVSFGMVSNQGGIALHFLTETEAMDLLEDCWLALGISPERRLYTMLCPHAPRAGCRCRKPQPGMLLALLARAQVLPGEALYVGDQPSDEEAARRAGIDFLYAHEFFGWDETPAHYEPVL